jgi:hypothetical protein
MLSTNNVFAGPSYTASPLVIDVEAEARDIIPKEFTITNTGTQPVTVYPTVNNVSLEEANRIDEFLPPVMSDRTSSLASWIEVSRRGVDIPVGESRTVKLTLRINPQPEPGTYHALIGLGHGRNQTEAIKQVMNGTAPGVIVTVTIEEKTVEFLKLSKFIIDKFVTSSDNKAAVFSFKNPGDETLIPKGDIIFYNSKGSEISSVEVNDSNTSIAPGGEHVFTVSVPTDGLFGKYKAYLSVDYGQTQKGSIQDTNFFYVFPLKIVLLILAILILLTGIGAWHIHRKYFDEDIDDSDRLHLHVKEGHSGSHDHDINLKQP